MGRRGNLHALYTSTTDRYELHALTGLDRVRSPGCIGGWQVTETVWTLW
jgi:hypothetical protein